MNQFSGLNLCLIHFTAPSAKTRVEPPQDHVQMDSASAVPVSVVHSYATFSLWLDTIKCFFICLHTYSKILVTSSNMLMDWNQLSIL